MSTPGPIALVLAGGGMRGAYQAGALAELGPELDRRGERVEIIVGTSIGYWNGAFLAAQAHRPLGEATAALADVWRRVRFRDIADPVTSLRSMARGARYFLLAGLPLRTGFPPPRSVLRATPLSATLRRWIDFDRLADNVHRDTGPLASAAVVATSYATTRSVVFHAGRAKPQSSPDPIDYVATPIRDVHLRASSAIQAILPPVNVPDQNGTAHWYGDGGARLNSPLEPALALGARSVIAIGLNSSVTPTAEVAEEEPDLLEGAAQMMQTALADQLARDVARLDSMNEQALENNGHGVTPYMLVARSDRFVIGRTARDVYTRLYAGVSGLRRDPDVAILGHIADVRRGAVHGEIFSYVFTSCEFTQELVALGRRDAREWLCAAHDVGPWQTSARGAASEPRAWPATPARGADAVFYDPGSETVPPS